MCQYAQNCGTHFRNFDFKLIEILRLGLVSAVAAELYGPTGLTSLFFQTVCDLTAHVQLMV